MVGIEAMGALNKSEVSIGDQVYRMKIGEVITLSSYQALIIRVPGGWIFETFIPNAAVCCCFVPDNEPLCYNPPNNGPP
jgi:hypothetical protein